MAVSTACVLHAVPCCDTLLLGVCAYRLLIELRVTDSLLPGCCRWAQVYMRALLAIRGIQTKEQLLRK